MKGLADMGKINDVHRLLYEAKEYGMVPNVYTYALLLEGYCKADRIEDAVKLFKKLDYEKVELNFVVYNILIAAYCRIGNVMEAFKLRDATKSGGILPTCATYSSLIQKPMNIIYFTHISQPFHEKIVGIRIWLEFLLNHLFLVFESYLNLSPFTTAKNKCFNDFSFTKSSKKSKSI